MVLIGYVRRLTADLTPGAIIDAATADTGDPAMLAARCLEGVDAGLAERVREGDVLALAGSIAGGAGAEVAVIALQAAGFAAVICRAVAPDVAAIGAIYGLPLLTSPACVAAVGEGDLVRIDLERGRAESGGAVWEVPALGADELAAVRRGQLLAHMRRVVEDEGYGE